MNLRWQWKKNCHYRIIGLQTWHSMDASSCYKTCPNFATTTTFARMSTWFLLTGRSSASGWPWEEICWMPFHQIQTHQVEVPPLGSQSACLISRCRRRTTLSVTLSVFCLAWAFQRTPLGLAWSTVWTRYIAGYRAHGRVQCQWLQGRLSKWFEIAKEEKKNRKKN